MRTMDTYFLPRLIRTPGADNGHYFLAPLDTDIFCGFLLNWISPGSRFAAFSKLVLDLIHFQPPLIFIHAEGKYTKSTTGRLKINPALPHFQE